MTSAISIVDDLASRQWALVTRQQMMDAGIAPRQIGAMLRSRSLRRVGRRVYATFGAPRAWEQKVLAEVLSAGPAAVASHAPAARLWNYVHLPMDGLDVTIEVDRSSSSTVRRRGLHHTLILPAEDVANRSGIPCTSFERTLCDCTTLLSPFQLGRVLDDGLRRGEASLTRLQESAARLDSGPGRRLSVIKRLLDERDAAFDPGGSASELHLLDVIREAGLPEPVQQHPVHIDGTPYSLDFAWPDKLVFAEFYGLAVHSGASAVAHDSHRQTGLVSAGWRPLVFTDTTSDRVIVRSVSALLAIGQRD